MNFSHKSNLRWEQKHKSMIYSMPRGDVRIRIPCAIHFSMASSNSIYGNFVVLSSLCFECCYQFLFGWAPSFELLPAKRVSFDMEDALYTYMHNIISNILHMKYDSQWGQVLYSTRNSIVVGRSNADRRASTLDNTWRVERNKREHIWNGLSLFLSMCHVYMYFVSLLC